MGAKVCLKIPGVSSGNKIVFLEPLVKDVSSLYNFSYFCFQNRKESIPKQKLVCNFLRKQSPEITNNKLYLKIFIYNNRLFIVIIKHVIDEDMSIFCKS